MKNKKITEMISLFLGVKMETLQNSSQTWNLCWDQEAKSSTGKNNFLIEFEAPLDQWFPTAPLSSTSPPETYYAQK